MLPKILFLACATLSWTARAMRADRLRRLRQDTVDMFYHGYNNYMEHAFPEDELRPLTCGPLTRDRENPGRIGLNDALGNYSLTLIDSLSTLAILAGGPTDGPLTGKQALSDFQDGIARFVEHYGDGRHGASGTGSRATGFDLDSKVQVFETVIRGVGGLLSAHLFATGELPIRGYKPVSLQRLKTDDPMELAPISWSNGFQYDGQLLRLAFDLGERLLPAFYTPTGIPYPRVNLHSGIPFYVNSPLHQATGEEQEPVGRPEITETCSAGAGSLILEFTVLSRLTGDPRFEQAAKRAFWEVWHRRSEIGLIGNGIDAERGVWIGPHSGIGAGMDSFFEYALKSHVLLSGQGMPNASSSHRQSKTDWLDPNSLHPPLSPELHSSEAFLQAWHQAHASVKRYLYTDRSQFPYYSNSHRATGQPYTMWIDSLSAFYSGLLALAGEVEEAIEANLVYTALWTRYSAIPERWSVRENNVEPGIGWWPGRPEFVESTYYIYRATKDPWYLHVGEMVLQDIQRRCHAPCGWAGLQDVRTGEKQDRMESFFLGETTKYMYLLFDPDHELNKLDAAFVFNTEGHPLIIPKSVHGRSRSNNKHKRSSLVPPTTYYNESFTNSCPNPRAALEPLAGSVTAARRDLFDVSRFTSLYTTPNMHGPIESFEVEEADRGLVTRYRAVSNHSLFPWTLPPTMLPMNGTCDAPPDRVISWIDFPVTDPAASLLARLGNPILWYEHVGPTVQSLDGLKLQLEREPSEGKDGHVWKITHVGHTQLGKHETVFFHAEHVRHFKDDAFTSIRRGDVVDMIALYEPQQEPPEDANATMILAPTDAVHYLSDDTGFDSNGSENDNNNNDSQPFLRTILRAVSSVFDPLSTEAPGFDDDLDAAHGTIFTWQANTPSGIGAFPVPSTDDTPITGSPGFNDADAVSNFPWRTVFLAGQACDGPLPASSSHNHQVIVILRGGCSFSAKLDNIPSFAPGRNSLQIVIVVDERGEPDNHSGETTENDGENDGENDSTKAAKASKRGSDSSASENNQESKTPRPILDSAQVSPRGVRRLHGIPMVLISANVGDYERFRHVTGVGMRRKYKLKSQGLMIANAIVL